MKQRHPCPSYRAEEHYSQIPGQDSWISKLDLPKAAVAGLGPGAPLCLTSTALFGMWGVCVCVQVVAALWGPKDPRHSTLFLIQGEALSSLPPNWCGVLA